MVLFGLSCSPNLNQSTSKTTVTVLYDTDEYTWATWDVAAQLLVFLPLGDRGHTPGSLAESWEHSEDFRTWTVQLREGVRWHDGVPVTADDVQFSVDLYSHPDVLWMPPGSCSIQVLGPHSYTATYAQEALVGGMIGSPLDGFRKILPKHLLKDLDPGDFASWDFWTHPVGSGPYRYVRHVPKTLIEFEANPDYYRGKPEIERVILRFGSPSVTQLLSGEVDVVQGTSLEELRRIAGDERFKTYHSVFFQRVSVFGWNQRIPLFQDPRVRQALIMAIDRRELHSLMDFPEMMPIFDGIVTKQQYRNGDVPEPLPFDPEMAKQLLEEAGWRDSDGDGVLDKDGAPFRFRAEAQTYHDVEKAAVVIQSRLRNIGIEMDIVPRDLEATRDTLFGGDFEAAVFSITPFGGAVTLGKTLDALSYTNPRVFELLEKASSVFNPDEVESFRKEVASLLREDLPYLTLYPGIMTTVAHPRIRGLRSPDRAVAVAFMEDLWIEDE
jgi:peptide/nickel transport system substrate-binding protein